MADSADSPVDGSSSGGLACGRSRRQKRENVGRVAALDKLRRREKNKCEVPETAEEDALYDLVDESEYSRRVQERLQDDWIVDDGGGEYVEDGREIFDDDIVDDGRSHSSRKEKRKVNKRVSDPTQPKKNNLRDMLLQMPANKKVKREVKLDDDEDLQSIIQGIQQSAPPTITPSSAVSRNYPAANTQSRRSAAPLSLTPKTPFARVDSNSAGRSVMSSRSPHPLQNLNKMTPACDSVQSAGQWRDSTEQNKPQTGEPIRQVKQEKENEEMEALLGEDDCVFDETPLSSIIDVTSKSDVTPVVPKHEVKAERSSHAEEDAVLNRGVADMWTRTTKLLDQTSTVTSESPSAQMPVVDASTLPLVDDESCGEKVFRFFWLDAFADSAAGSSGTVYLFGRTTLPNQSAAKPSAPNSTVSCCVRISDIPRRVFLLPRVKRLNLRSREEGDDVTLKDVYDEFNTVIASRFKISEFRSKMSSKKYAFELAGVPDEAEYLEIVYSAKYRALPTDLEGETFSHVFGANTSWLEHVLLGARIRGPSWLRIRRPQLSSTRLSFCSVEVCASWGDQHSVLISPQQSPPPPLVVLTLCTRSVVNQRSRQNEVVTIAALVHRQFRLDGPAPSPLFQEHFCALTRPGDAVWPFDFDRNLAAFSATTVRKCGNEKALLSLFLAKMNKIDPDIVIGHNVYGFDLDILLNRCRLLKLNSWSYLGRLRRSADVLFKSKSSDDWLKRSVMCGRLLCDSFLSAKELTRQKSYDLPELSRSVLKLPDSEVVQISADSIAGMFNSSQSILSLVTCSMQEAHNTIRILAELNALPLAMQITCLAGNLMSRTLLGGRAERNEFLLLHAFTERGFIPPDKHFAKRKPSLDESCHLAVDDGNTGTDDVDGATGKSRRKAKYGGGLVLEPKRGFYDQYILLMDFNSLYPSIIQEYNICFTTLPRAATATDEDDADRLPELPDSSLETGVLPSEIKKLVDRRREVKKLMKNQSLSEEERTQLDVRQKALKLTANSMYGCLGFESSRFYARHLAALITAKGRDILMQTKSLVEKMDLEVIYGDTDSIMINSRLVNYDRVMELGKEIKREVNKLYRLLELDIDGLYRYMLLLKKKKYAAVSAARAAPSGGEGRAGVISFTRELKGLDIVRRDWCKLAADTGLYVIDQIFSGLDHDEKLEKIHGYLEQVRGRLLAGEVSLADLAVTKELKKNPEEYADKKGQAHVNVALRVNSKSARKFRRGDTVQYIICQDGSSADAMQRAYSVDEVRHSRSSNNNNSISGGDRASVKSEEDGKQLGAGSVSEKMDEDGKESGGGAGVKSESVFLTVDVDYYLANQVHPVVSRLLEPVECTDSARVAQCLGLDASKYRQMNSGGSGGNSGYGDAEDRRLGGATSAANRFAGCKPLTVRCVGCRQNRQFAGSPLDGGVLSLSRPCDSVADSASTASGCDTQPLQYLPLLVNQLRLQSQTAIRQYLQGTLYCEDPCCSNETRALPFEFDSVYPVCDLCRKALLIPKYDERQLHNQLCYFQHIFDLDSVLTSIDAKQKQSLKRLSNFEAIQKAYSTLHEQAHKTLSMSNYSQVDLGTLFADMAVASGSIKNST